MNMSWKAPEEVTEYRRNLCESCDSYTMMKTCSECGCFVMFKTTLKDASCPIGKWASVSNK